MNEEPVEVQETSPRRGKGDPFGAVFWGLTLVWLGTSMLLNLKPWLYAFLIGLGCIFIVDGVLRQLWATQKKPAAGKFLTGVILIIVGLALVYRVFTWWPIIPIIVGLGILIAGLMRVRESGES